MNLKKFTACMSIVALVFCLTASASVAPTRPFDEFADVNCEDEMARLDNFAIQLHNDPHSKGVVMFYSGKTGGDKLPRRGEAEARTARIKPYLVQRRGVPADQVLVINAGYDEYYRVQLWIVPPGAALPRRESPSPNQIRFRKGKVTPRDFRCQI